MKNKDIHNQFDDKEIRDRLAKDYQENHSKSFGYSLEFLKEELERVKNLIQEAERVEAIENTLTRQGWDYWDISDEIDDYCTDTYFGFVGTKEEFEKLISLEENTTG